MTLCRILSYWRKRWTWKWDAGGSPHWPEKSVYQYQAYLVSVVLRHVDRSERLTNERQALTETNWGMRFSQLNVFLFSCEKLVARCSFANAGWRDYHSLHEVTLRLSAKRPGHLTTGNQDPEKDATFSLHAPGRLFSPKRGFSRSL